MQIWIWSFCLMFGVSRLVTGLFMGHWITPGYWEFWMDTPIVQILDIGVFIMLLIGIVGACGWV